jgi:hypothetical protein
MTGSQIFGRIGKALVAEDARVVDQDVDLSKSVQRGLENVLAAFDRRDVVIVRDRLTAGSLDLIRDLIGHR